MKHCIIKLLVVVAIGMFSLPRLYAQNNLDTTITIYGKNFSPQVIVKLNGTPISNFWHDILKPSRILYVTIPLASLKTGTATLIAGTKQNGASLNSSDNVNEITVANPGQIGLAAKDTIIVKPKAAQIAFVSSTSLDTLAALKLRIPLSFTRDTLIRIQYQGLTTGAKQIQFSLSDTTFAQIYDSLGNVLSLINISNRSGLLSFRIRFKAFAQLPTDSMNRQIQLRAEIKTVATLIGQKSIRLEIFPVRIRYVVTAAKAAQENFLVQRGGTSILRSESIFSENYFSEALHFLEERLNNFQDSLSNLHQVSKFAQTRFTSRQPTIILSSIFPNFTLYEPTDSLIGIHHLVDRISMPPPIIIPRLADEFVVMMSNFWNDYGYSPYRAIGSQCQNNTIPEYIIVEAKYVKGYIDPYRKFINPQFWLEFEQIVNAIP
jgi:hypothetical protein